MTTPLQAINQAFANARSAGRAALMPYHTLGYPTQELSLDIIEAAARAGADLIELGVPFSDPLADGPTIQRSTQIALEQGMTLERSLEMVSELRHRGVQIPLLLMSYTNLLLSHGFERLAAEAAAAGANGFIVPDLPMEEAGELEAACQAHHLALVYMLAPTSTPERMAAIAARSQGFIYLVSLTGVTGARQELPMNLGDFIARVRQATPIPLAVGFGIATPEQAAAVGKLADGVIVGSAFIHAVDQDPADPARSAGHFTASLRLALEAPAAAVPAPPVTKPSLPDDPTFGFLGC
jgi:tryptophan synthase alpha chain